MMTTRMPRPQARRTTPRAAVVLPLPFPVLTTTNAFRGCFSGDMPYLPSLEEPNCCQAGCPPDAEARRAAPFTAGVTTGLPLSGWVKTDTSVRYTERSTGGDSTSCGEP